MKPDISQWRSSSTYDFLDDIDSPDIAWEWLRRNAKYQGDYRAVADAANVRTLPLIPHGEGKRAERQQHHRPGQGENDEGQCGNQESELRLPAQRAIPLGHRARRSLALRSSPSFSIR